MDFCKTRKLVVVLLVMGLFAIGMGRSLVGQEVVKTAEDATAEDATAEDDQEVEGKAPKSLKEKASFLVGYQFMADLKQEGLDLDWAQLIRGMKMASQGADPGMDPEEIEAVQLAFFREVNKRLKAEFEKLAALNLVRGKAFLVENGKKKGVITLDSGVQYSVVTAGTGKMPTETDRVKVHYRGVSLDGQELVTTLGGPPADLVVGSQMRGFIDAVKRMKVGGTWKVVIPSKLSYGAAGSQFIGPNETVVYELQLLEIVAPDAEKTKPDSRPGDQ